LRKRPLQQYLVAAGVFGLLYLGYRQARKAA
jgi:hypothetical protein